MECKISVLMYKAWNANPPENLQCLFQSNGENEHYTWKHCNFKVEFSKSKIKFNCLPIIGDRLWSKLGNNMKTCRSLIKFKNKMLKSTYLKNIKMYSSLMVVLIINSAYIWKFGYNSLS